MRSRTDGIQLLHRRLRQVEIDLDFHSHESAPYHLVRKLTDRTRNPNVTEPSNQSSTYPLAQSLSIDIDLHHEASCQQQQQQQQQLTKSHPTIQHATDHQNPLSDPSDLALETKQQQQQQHLDLNSSPAPLPSNKKPERALTRRPQQPPVPHRLRQLLLPHAHSRMHGDPGLLAVLHGLVPRREP